MSSRNKVWEWVKRDTTLTNAAVAIFTIVIAAVGFLQWNAIDGQLHAMIDADRPWVGAISESSDSVVDPSKTGTAKLSVLNTGRSPARIIRFQAAQNIFPSFPDDPPYQNTTPWKELSHTLLLPGGVMTVTNEFPVDNMDPRLLQLVMSSQAKLYIYGRVEYEDLRVKNSRHTTHICFFWTIGKQSNPFVTCPEYNDAD